MAQFYWNGAVADWETTNWQDAGGSPLPGAPQDGDTIYIASGTVTVALFDQEGAASNQTIFLGSAGESGVPTLDTTDQAFFSGTIQETGDYLNAAWVARGETSFQGTLNVTGGNSSLVLSAISDGGAPANPGVFDIQTGGVVNVGEEGTLDFVQGTLQVDGLLSIHGGVTFESGTVFSGEGTAELAGNSSLIIRGAADGGLVNFNGKNATLEIDDLAHFNANITGFTTSDTIDLSGIVADGWSYNITPGATVGTLTLFDGMVAVDTISIAYGEGSNQTKNPFIVTTDGTNTTVQAGGQVIVKDALPVTIFGTAGQQISLATILTDAFGSTANFSSVYVSYDNAAFLKSSHFEYWTGNPSDKTVTAWSVKTPAGTPDSEDYLGAPVSDFANTYLTIGTDIKSSAGIEIPVVNANGVVTEYLEYMITVADPSLEQAPAASLTEPTPQDIVASAYAFDAKYGDKVLLNTEDCESIARDVAGAAGAVHGGNDLNPDTLSTQTANLNQPDGFWRIAYDGADVAVPATDWFSLLQPGDIVRIGWTSASGVGIKNGHTTTILAVNLDAADPSQSTITVYDNTAKDANGDEAIGVHTVKASNWENTANPAYITIFRLTTDGRYLVDTQAGNQIVHDTVYNDDVELVGSGDTIYGGSGDEMIRGFSADLQGLTLVDAHAGDFFQFKDATAVTPTYDQATGVLTVAYMLAGNMPGSATIQLTPGMSAAFVVAAATDGTGETVTVDQPPVLLDVPTAVTYASGSAVILAPGLTITDVHGTTLSSATVHVSAGAFAAHGDVLSVSAADVAGTSIVASYDAGSETLTLSGTDTLAHYQQALENVAFQTTNFASDRAQTIDWQVDDGASANNLSDVETTAVSMLRSQTNDFNGNGHSAILWQNADGTPAIWTLDGTNLISGSNVGFDPGPSWHEIGSGDFNGDGKADILWQNNDGTIAAWFMNGTQLISGGNVAFNPGPAWHAIGTGDFNDDGQSDILLQNTDGTAAVWLMNGLNIQSGANVGFNPGPSWHVIGAGDFDGDGKADILWQNNDGTAAAWFMNGTQLVSGGNVAFNPGPSWHAVATGDFNGDGKSDILFQNADGTPAVWLMDGLNILSGANVGFNPGASWHVIGTGDFNGDGKSDILWQNTDGTAAVWLMNGTSVISGANVGFDPGASWHAIPQHHDVLV